MKRESKYHKKWREKNKKYYKRYKDKWYRDNSLRLRDYRLHVKQTVYDNYGNKCNCCGETEKKFLTIDHVNNDGYKTRNGGGGTDKLYRQIIKEKFPDKYQILCYNCNLGKARNNGSCPHNDIDL